MHKHTLSSTPLDHYKLGESSMKREKKGKNEEGANSIASSSLLLLFV
jgi:hypothetical protein